MNDRPQLEKGSKKYICPACNKRSFVYYRNADNSIIDEVVGRCDRVDNCGYHLPPKEWYKLHPNNNTQKLSYTPSNRIVAPKQAENKPIDYVPLKYILDSAKTRNNNLIYFLLDLFDWEGICTITDQYFLGCTKDRSVIYPMIDDMGKCRTGKIQQYDRATGKRLKTDKGGIDWVHSRLKQSGVLPKDFNLSLCLFGLHLIRSEKNKGKTICICESEKSAIISALFLPEYIWMASGALEWLNVDKLKPLKGRKVLLFPDTSKTQYAYTKWQKIADQASKIGIDITVSTLLENLCDVEDKGKGYDIGDLIIESIQKSRSTKASDSKDYNTKNNNVLYAVSKPDTPNKTKRQITALETMKQANPVLNDLIEVFDLDLIQCY